MVQIVFPSIGVSHNRVAHLHHSYHLRHIVNPNDIGSCLNSEGDSGSGSEPAVIDRLTSRGTDE
jgi:hypothetical protein